MSDPSATLAQIERIARETVAAATKGAGSAATVSRAMRSIWARVAEGSLIHLIWGGEADKGRLKTRTSQPQTQPPEAVLRHPHSFGVNICKGGRIAAQPRACIQQRAG